MKGTNKSVLIGMGIFLILSIFMFSIAQDFPTPSKKKAAVQETAPGTTFIDLLISGGEVMIPLGLASIIGVALTIELFLRLRMKKYVQTKLNSLLNTHLNNNNYTDAEKLCAENKVLVLKAFAEALKKRDHKKSEIETIIAEKLQRGMSGGVSINNHLSSVGVISPLLGLLGTVTGMIKAFNVIAMQEGLGKPALLAKGVAEALITTAAGLIIAIPVMTFFYFFRAKIKKIMIIMGEEATNFVDTLLSSQGRKE